MAESYFPFDAGSGANVTEDQWRKMAGLWLQSGVFRGELNGLAVAQRAAGANMSVDVSTGKAWVKGHYYETDAILNKAIAANSSGNPRIDRIVLRAHFVNNVVSVEVLQGTPAASPVAPTLTDNATMKEISLAQIAVANGAASIVTANITDERTHAYAPAGLTPIAEAVVLADVATIVFANIPQTYRHLILLYQGRSTASGSGDAGLTMRCNGDTGANYQDQDMNVSGGSITGAFYSALTTGGIGHVSAASAAAADSGAGMALFANYARINHRTQVWGIAAYGHTTQSTNLRIRGSVWLNQNALTSLTLAHNVGNIKADSVYTLYGLGVL